MAKFYDISARITNELPTLKITDELIVTVNNRKNTVLNVQAMVSEMEKQKEGTKEEQEFVMIKKALIMLIGEKNAAAIEEMDLPVPEYSAVFKAVMMVAQGKSPDEADVTP